MKSAIIIKSIFKEYNKLLCNVSFNIVNDRQVAEDLVQDVFFNLWKKIDTLNLEKSLKGYLYQSTINISINHLQRNKSQAHIELDESYLEKIFFSDDVNEIIETKELTALIQKSINGLPPKCKSIFILNRQEDLKYRQIAERLNISTKTVENQISIALKKIRSDLSPYVDLLPIATVVLLNEFMRY